MASSFIVNQADLAFILEQIKLAESTSLAYTDTPLTTLQAIMDTYGVSAQNAAQLPVGLRTVSGVDNNLLPGQSTLGAADTLFPRLLDPVFSNEGDETPFNGISNTNYALPGNVIDSDPRTISNLIVDMSIANPAVVEAYLANPLALEQFEIDHPGLTPVAPGDPLASEEGFLAITNEDLQTLPNLSPDIGLSPGFNSWMTFFGQFFDHGLDLVTKGGNETVFIPLQADDPLIAGADGIFGNTDDLLPQLRFMALTRATVTLDANGVPQHENTTTPFIDQNQTYTSHASHQVFLREYARVGTETVATGKFLDGAVAGSIANWADIKAQALDKLGIVLSDFDVHNVPLLATDQYGKFIPGPNGYAQVATASGLVEGTATGLVLPADTIRTNHAFLNDIAHHAAPGFVDLNRNGTLDLGTDTPDDPLDDEYLQVADANVDRNGDGIYDFADLDVNGDTIVTDEEIASLVADVNHDGVVDLLDVDRNLDGVLTDFDFDIDRNGVVNAADLVADDRNANTYDNEMLDAHFITGDGRGNENAALTAVHSIFHSEHNRLVDANKQTIIAAAQAGDVAFLNEWLVVDVEAVPTDLSSLVWDGERLFQAARFGTEMQYQHLVFEEFARRIQPAVDPFVFNNSPNIDPSIVAEFAHTVYRFGHSMLTGTVDRLENDLTTVDGDTDQQTLLAMFLNPQAYLASGDDAATINANFVRGLTRDVGNAIDEFIVTDVRSNLLGLPLDLGALNIARGRDTGIPSLNEARSQLYEDTGLADLKPYTSWADFAANIKNPLSIVNFIAAYGTHATIVAETTLAGKRAAAEDLVFDTTGDSADREAFINGTGAYAADLGGLNVVDLWVGGLAEANPEFGGMLGTTFNYVFEYQMEALQFGDRLYYLTRTQGTNFLNQLEPNTFTDLVMRNSDLGGIYSTHLNGALFVTPDAILELDTAIAQEDYNGDAAGLDLLWAPGEAHSPLTPLKVMRTVTSIDSDGHVVGGTLRFTGGEHVVLGGTEGNDKLYGDRGIDTLWGDGGNDYLNAGTESDNVFGGEGDDIIEDPFGDDVLRGNQGNDVISSARGLDLLFGDQGSDYILVGQDASEVFGGTDDDFILGGVGGDFLQGNEGNDWIEGAGGFDTLAGENSELFFNSPLIGHDVLFGQGDETDYDAESGDDIMGSGPSVFRYEGMFGFDWGIAKYDTGPVQFDLNVKIFTTVPNDILRDRFDNVEAVSGWQYGDTLDGDNRGHVFGTAPAPLTFDPATADLLFFDTDLNGNTTVDNLLTNEGVDRITGFREWFDGAATTLGTVEGTQSTDTFFRDGNILMGGDGDDVIQGRGGFDVIDGDAWLNVRIKITVGTTVYSAESMNTDTTVMGPYAGKVFNTDADGNPIFTSPAFGGKSLNALMLEGTINPGQLSIVREIKYDDTDLTGPDKSIDTAVYQGVLADYEIEGFAETGRATDLDGDGFIRIRDLENGADRRDVFGQQAYDDTDLIKNIEQLRFADQTIRLDETPPTDILWTGVTPANALPGAGSTIATLSSTDFDTASGFVYSLAAGSSAGFAVSAAGAVTATAAMAANRIYTLLITSTDPEGASRTETFTITTGANGVADVIVGGLSDDIIYGGGGADVITGDLGDDNLFGQAGADDLDGEAGNDILVGGAGADIIAGDIGNDTIRYTVDTDGADEVDGGDDIDTLELTSGAGSENLNVTFDGTSITEFEGGEVANVEIIVADLGGGNDTLTYTAPGGVTVDLAAGTASGFTSIANIENVTTNGGADTIFGDGLANIINGGGSTDTIDGRGGVDTINGGAGADTIDGGAGNDAINGGAGADRLIGGAGADQIDTGAANDNAQDVIRYVAVGDYGPGTTGADTISNFDANGATATDDRIEFSAAFAALFNDGIADATFQFISGNGVNAGNTAANLNGTNEALYLSGVNGEGVSSAGANDLDNAAAVAAEFNAEFNITAADGETTLLVINDTNANSAAVWQWTQAGGGEIAAAELTLIGVINANATVTTDNFGFF